MVTQVTEISTPPTPADPPGEFEQKAAKVWSELHQAVPQMNQQADEIEQIGADAQTAKDRAIQESDAALGYRNETRAARDAALPAAVTATDMAAQAMAAKEHAEVARDDAQAAAQAAVNRVAKTSDTGAAILPEGDDSERPASGEIPDGSLVVRGNTQDVDNYIAEYWDRVTSAWRAFASRTWVGQQISSAVNGLQTQINALKAIRYEPEALWTGNTGAVVELTLSREVLEGELLVLKHVNLSGLTHVQAYLPSVGHQSDGGTYMNFTTGTAYTGCTLRKPAATGGPSIMKMLTFTSGYSVVGIYAIKQVD